MQMTPTIAIHMTFALSAVAIGPLALWARLAAVVRPRWHRAFGYAWVTCMLGSAVLEPVHPRLLRMPNLGGYTPIHIMVPVTLFSLWRAFRYLAQGNHRGHQLTMQFTYALACVVTGLFTLLPQRYLGQVALGTRGWARPERQGWSPLFGPSRDGRSVPPSRRRSGCSGMASGRWRSAPCPGCACWTGSCR
jgi:uncharacterized membrane protein